MDQVEIVAHALAELEPTSLRCVADMFGSVELGDDPGLDEITALARSLVDNEFTEAPPESVEQVVTALRWALMEDAVFAHHVEFAEEEFGKDVQTNIGWGVDEGCISSKIYDHGVVTTWFDEFGINDEQFEEF